MCLEYLHHALSNLFSLILIPGNVCEIGMLGEMETFDQVVDIDNNVMDPQCCATIACDIYKHLRVSEVCILLHNMLYSLCFSFFLFFKFLIVI